MLFTVTNDNDCVKVGIQFRNTVPMVTRIVLRETSTGLFFVGLTTQDIT